MPAQPSCWGDPADTPDLTSISPGAKCPSSPGSTVPLPCPSLDLSASGPTSSWPSPHLLHLPAVPGTHRAQHCCPSACAQAPPSPAHSLPLVSAFSLLLSKDVTAHFVYRDIPSTPTLPPWHSYTPVLLSPCHHRATYLFTDLVYFLSPSLK